MASADVDRYQVLMCKNFIDLLQLVGVAMNKLNFVSLIEMNNCPTDFFLKAIFTRLCFMA